VGASPINTGTSWSALEPGRWPRPEAQNGRLSIFSVHDLPNLLARVVGVMEHAGYGAVDTFAVRLALEEAAVNAVTHGHGHDPRKQVRIRWSITPASVRLIVVDEGPGFDAAAVADPRLPENLERPSGRGLLLMSAYMTWMRFNRRGNCVVMCRHRSPGSSRCHSQPPAVHPFHADSRCGT
jgi:serine/threonine-protein kinase RsbW